MNRTGYLLMSAAAGVLAGILMAVFLLFFFLPVGFSMNNAMFWIGLVAGISLPQCLNILKRQWLSPLIAQMTMIVVSYFITCLYAFAVGSGSTMTSASETTTMQIILLFVVVHFAALLGAVGIYLVQRRNARREDK